MNIKTMVMGVCIFGWMASYGQTPNTSPLPNGETVIGNHLHANSDEVWTDKTSLYFNWRGSATKTYFWNLGGSTGGSLLTLDNAGKAGFGTSSPEHALHLAGAVNGEINFVIQNNYGALTKTFVTSTPTKSSVQTNKDFSIVTHSGAGWTDKLVVKNSGDVGIGISSPLAPLHINGAGAEVNLLIQNGSSGAKTYLSSLPAKSSIQTDKDFTINFNNGSFWQERFIIKNSGEVGVGTLSPQAPLHIYNEAAEVNLLVQSSLTGGAKTYLTSFVGKSSIQTDKQFTVATKAGGIWSDKFVALDHKLDVNGTIHTKEVVVDLNVPAPDYVFEPDYDLATLVEVETYIKENKHLPEVPSAKEMGENGINLKEMNLLLLKKVEELTLYLIEQNSTIDAQQSQIKALQMEVKRLEMRITK